MTESHPLGDRRARLRAIVFAATLLLLVQSAIGFVVNLYVVIPPQHPGAHPSDYFVGSFHSVVWAIAHGAVGLAVHAALGVALVVIVIVIAINALRIGGRSIGVWSSIAAMLVIGAAFNGASFLDFNHNTSSLIMALLAFGAIACYSGVMFLLPSVPILDR